MKEEILLDNIDKVHTTKMGIDRIIKNLDIHNIDPVQYCKNLISEKIVIYIAKVKICIVKSII